MFQGDFGVYQGVARWSRVVSSVLSCSKGFLGISKIVQCVPGCDRMFQGVSGCSRVFQGSNF